MRLANQDGDWSFPISEVDGFLMDGDVAPFPVPQVLEWIIGVDANMIQIVHIGAHVGYPPGNVVIVPDDNPRRGGERKAGHAKRRLSVYKVQPYLVPDRWYLDP